jgi:hypothetical protein
MDYKKLRFPLMLSLTLGLAPWFPEPHIWGKIKWLAGGAEGMQGADYFDILLHGAPWVYLIVTVIIMLKKQIQNQ